MLQSNALRDRIAAVTAAVMKAPPTSNNKALKTKSLVDDSRIDCNQSTTKAPMPRLMLPTNKRILTIELRTGTFVLDVSIRSFILAVKIVFNRATLPNRK